ncbi:hypothetical protein SHAM105786_08500 [Shewanella amazonensis]|uniref:PKD domain-containing protein n=1 Tax=Shewanella amazonensis (strain ATCC BAA-1098 / SB2B) TaxID=326297 RepID=A1S2J6_SHEAM|nr:MULTISPECIES: hypothetical protein [Shewanella]ABL98602.1 hypothetical protein Sama_0391 [Shewanella amazonensis SB2B]QYJ75798.1 hypothetical protein K0H79_02055 [Shewanella sp. FJAT-52076]
MAKFNIGRLSLIMLFYGVSSNVFSAPVEYIANGDFETGDFSGWNITDSGSGAWVINDGTFDPTGPGEPLPPISGTYDIVSHQGGPGLHIATQPISLPTAIKSATLSWADRIRSYAEFSDPNQEWRVLVEDTNGNLLQEVFSTNPGDPTQQIGPNNRSFDLTALLQTYQGQQVVISFEEQDDQLYFNATLDDVSLEITQLTLSCVGGGFEPPFSDPIVIFGKKNMAIPVKFKLIDADGVEYTFDDIAPPVVNISYSPLVAGPTIDVTDDLLPLGNANDDNIFRWDVDGQKWIYNLGTKPYKSLGTYTVSVAPGSSDYTVDSSCEQIFERQ